MYLNMDCKICGRHRVEEDYICEKCGYDNKNLTFSSVKARKTTQEVITVDKLSQPILECLEHGAGTCRNEYLIERLQESCVGFRNKNKTLAEELHNLRIAKCSDAYWVTDNARLHAKNNKLIELVEELWHNIQLMDNWESYLEDSEVLQMKVKEVLE